MAALSLDEFELQAQRWLKANATPRRTSSSAAWGEGSDDVSVFHDLTHDEEVSHLGRAMEWQQRKFDAGYGALAWPSEFGGADLGEEYELAFRALEEQFELPAAHETFSVTLHLIAPTIRVYGTAEQQKQ
jgi:alkylation response protein AidB-like acyl-CoA dehydrogenase